jgi:hypothetical protein
MAADNVRQVFGLGVYARERTHVRPCGFGVVLADETHKGTAVNVIDSDSFVVHSFNAPSPAASEGGGAEGVGWV